MAAANSWGDEQRDALTMHMLAAIVAGVLPTKDTRTGLPLTTVDPNRLFHMVHLDDVNRWLEQQGVNYRWRPAGHVPDFERRLVRLRTLDGDAKFKRGEWHFTGIAKLVKAEKADGHKRSDEKTIRKDLRRAAQAEHDAHAAGSLDGCNGGRNLPPSSGLFPPAGGFPSGRR